MSLISKQIKHLRVLGNNHLYDLEEGRKAFLDAANTIEELSAKLCSFNMERSSAYYHGGWIPVEERLPKLNEMVIVSTKIGDVECVVYGLPDSSDEAPCFHLWDDEGWQCYKPDVIAWMPLPEAYKEKY